MKAIEQYQITINEFIAANKFSKFPKELYFRLQMRIIKMLDFE